MDSEETGSNCSFAVDGIVVDGQASVLATSGYWKSRSYFPEDEWWLVNLQDSFYVDLVYVITVTDSW